MKYSLRSLMIVVTLICVILGSALIWIKLERERTKRTEEAAKTLLSRGASLGVIGDLPKSEEELQTWRGDETWSYVTSCVFGRKSGDLGKKQVTKEDLALLSSEFPDLQEIHFLHCEIDAGGLRHLARLAQLEKIDFYDTLASEDEIRFLKAALPKTTIEK